ncbi:MAG: hypothetical protein WC404_07345 [Candidatus Omnitrophota bacterium]|jgi:hypothetical protein
MQRNTKKSYKKTIRVDGRLKSIIEKNFRDVSRRTGLRLSYGKVARAFWSTLASNANIRETCMKLVCRSLLEDAKKNKKKRCNL